MLEYQRKTVLSNHAKVFILTKLTGEIVSALTDNVYVYEDNGIETDIKFKDEYEMVMEYIS